MHRAPDARIVERLSLGIQPSSVNHALVEFRRRQAGRCRRFPGGGRVERPRVIHSARQDRGPKLRGKWQEMVDFDAIEVGQILVPVIRVSLHHPDLVLDPPFRLKRTGTGDVENFSQIVIILFQRLLAVDHVPAAGEGGHHEIDGAWRGQLEFDSVLVGALISLTALNSGVRGILTPEGGFAMRSKVAFMSADVKSVPSWNWTPWRR